MAGFGAAALAFAALPWTAHAIDESWTITDFGSDITIGQDGMLAVVETIKVNFLQPHHGIYRYVVTELPYDTSFNREYQVTDGGVYKTDGTQWLYNTSTSQRGFLEYVIGDPSVLLTGAQTYVIKYQVAGALDESGSTDGLAWHVMGDQWPVGAAHLHATVHAPAGASEVSGSCLEGTIASNTGCKATVSGSTVTYSADRVLDAGEDIHVEVGFPRGLIPTPHPILSRTLLGYFEINPFTVATAIAVLIAGFGFIYWQRSRTGAGSAPTIVEFSPPQNLRPAQLGLILDEVPDAKDVTATIIDFAARGYLTIQDTGDGDWTLYRRAGYEGLQTYEATIFQGLFGSGLDTVRISALTGNFFNTLTRAEDALAADAGQRRWFAGDPRSVITAWHFFGGAGVVAGAVLAWWLGSQTGFGLVGLAVAVVGAALIALARSLPRRTSAGIQFLQQTLGFRMYMLTAEKYRQQFAEHAEIFTQLLPYAIVFGCCDVWAKAFAGLATTPPQWYADGAGPFDPMLFSRRLQYFHGVVGASLAFVPPPPKPTGYSGFSVMGLGGGGGSRGGFSGGGGGGGGGAW